MSALRTAREAAGLTRDQVAERIGCSGSVLSRYESGEIAVPPERVRPLLDALGLTGPERVEVWRSIVPEPYRGAP